MNQGALTKDLNDRVAKAFALYWQTRAAQRQRQEKGGKADQGLRSAVTGGKQMDGFINLFTELVIQAGIPQEFILMQRKPGGYRKPTEDNGAAV